jgi:GWxTD domain-containing protein
MKVKIFLLILLLISFSQAQPEYSEVFLYQGSSKDKIPYLSPILFRSYPIAQNINQFKVYFIVEVMYDFIQFTYNENEYTAKYQIDINLVDNKSKQVFSKNWSNSFHLMNFTETNSRNKFHLSVDSLLIPPGKYNVTINYNDLQGKQKQTLTTNLKLSPIKDSYFPPPLFSDISEEYPRIEYSIFHRPLALEKHIPFNKQVKIILNPYIIENIDIRIKIELKSKNENQSLFSLDTLISHLESNKILSIAPNFLKMEEGPYRMNVHYKFGNTDIEKEYDFRIFWFNKPNSLITFNYAIKPLEVVLSTDEYQKITSGKQHKRYELFRNYWKSLDKTKNTAYNEVMVEFYNRVDSVDVKYGGKNNRYGWRNDPGRIYLLYGKPDEIADESLNPINPHMTWTYNMPESKIIFTFSATNGRKKYRLINQREISK